MRLRTHIWTSTLLGLACYPRRPWQATLLAAAGVLIDIDHMLVYNMRSGDWSVIGALLYNHYRYDRATTGDNRPRFGSLRSWLHQPLLALPLVWGLARCFPALRPAAIGLTLHVCLDGLDQPFRWQAHLRARGACEQCRRSDVRLSSYRLQPDGEDRQVCYVVLCRRCIASKG